MCEGTTFRMDVERQQWICIDCGLPEFMHDDEEDEFEEDEECSYCHDLGGNRYDDGATPCPVCGMR